MTKQDLYDLMDIIEECRAKESQLATRYAELNPDDADRRYDISADIKSGMTTVLLAIKEKYRNVWEGKA